MIIVICIICHCVLFFHYIKWISGHWLLSITTGNTKIKSNWISNIFCFECYVNTIKTAHWCRKVTKSDYGTCRYRTSLCEGNFLIMLFVIIFAVLFPYFYSTFIRPVSCSCDWNQVIFWILIAINPQQLNIFRNQIEMKNSIFSIQ